MPAIPVVPSVPDELSQPAEQQYWEPEPEPEFEEEEQLPPHEVNEWGEIHHSGKKLRNKIFRFILFEGMAVGLLLVSTKLEVAEQFSENSLASVYKLLMVVAVIAMAVIPVVYFALPPTLPRSRR